MFVMRNYEKLIIDRRRRGENQTQASRRWGVSQTTYALWERNKHNSIPETMLYEDHLQLELPTQAATLSEECYLKRRRAGLTQGLLAKKVGYSEEWLKRMERGEVNITPLVAYWKDK